MRINFPSQMLPYAIRISPDSFQSFRLRLRFIMKFLLYKVPEEFRQLILPEVCHELFRLLPATLSFQVLLEQGPYMLSVFQVHSLCSPGSHIQRRITVNMTLIRTGKRKRSEERRVGKEWVSTCRS